MKSERSRELQSRVDDQINAWRIVVERMAETDSSILAFGRRDDQPVVLKVIRNRGDEWHSGEILAAFEGNGVVSLIAKRVGRFASELRLDATRTLAWGFSQAVLAAIWAIEDGFAVEAYSPWVALADAIRPMLDGVIDV